MTTRSKKRAIARDEQEQTQEPKASSRPRRKTDGRRPSPWRVVAFLVIAVAILGAGAYLAGSVFMGQRGNSDNGLAVRLSMDGFDPKVIDAQAGQTVSLDFWNTDNAMHLDGGGVHSFIMDDQGIYVKIPAEARKQYSFTAPAKPGDYDFYCDTCCGGKASPTMHGTLHVTA
jgi:cytochrome c oxidase subunit 2